MDYFSRQVSRHWYKLYYAFMLTASLLLLAGTLITKFVPAFHNIGHQYGLSLTVGILASLHIIYSVAMLPFIRRTGWSITVFIASLLFTLLLLSAIIRTDLTMHSLPYLILWCVSAALSGSFSLPILAGSVFVTVLCVLQQSHYQILWVTAWGWIWLIGELAATGSASLFWRKRFVDVEAVKVNRLAGMVKSGQQQALILIQSITDGVIVTDTEGKIGLMNPAAAQMTEWPVDEATGVDVQLVVSLMEANGKEMESDTNPFKTTLSQKQGVSKTLQLKGRKGKIETISLVVSPVITPGTNQIAGSVAVIRDISEEHAAEQQRGEFISTASHEMRTPVAAIEGYLALALNDKVSTIDSRARGFLEKAHSSTQHLGKLFQDLLTSAKAEDGRLSSHPVVIEMGAFLQQLVDDLTFSAKKKGLATEFIIGSSETIDATNDAASNHVLKPLYYALADADRMREVITNLFDNAVKYTDEGKISIGITGDEQVVQFYIKDTGPGIPADDLPHLFQKFYRVDNSATRTIGGTGLGLFICRKIVELYHGRVWVESELGKGSTFFINLPRLDTQKALQLQEAEATTTANTLPNITSLTNS
jgi:PAS domain S-box-containing protein